MIADTIERLNTQFAESPITRANSVPSELEIAKASRDIGVPFDPDYEQFLRQFGAGMVGPYPIYGLRPVHVMGDDEWSVVAMTTRHREDEVPGCRDWVVVSSDHAGNPVGMDKEGRIWIHDHDFGGIAPLAKSFDEYIRVQCLKLPPIT